MINHWNIESTLDKDPGALAAYHLCSGDIIAKVQLRVWVYAPDGFGDYIPTLYQKRRDPIRNGYRGQAWIESPAQLDEIERYVDLVNGKRIPHLDTLHLRHPKDWGKFRQDIKDALLCPKSQSR